MDADYEHSGWLPLLLKGGKEAEVLMRYFYYHLSFKEGKSPAQHLVMKQSFLQYPTKYSQACRMDERSWIVLGDRAIMSVWHADLSAVPVSTC